jgi:hypothetical protein
MDYRKILESEMGDGHVAFHEFAMNIGKEPINVHFLFFEGNEDPSFYMPHISHRLGARGSRQFICNGREHVLKAHEMVQRDGRGHGRSLFFLDKDHSDILGEPSIDGLQSVFQTAVYSMENYLVSDEVFRAYWTQRLHLSEYDPRFLSYSERANAILCSFRRRNLSVTSLILCGRGIDGRPPVKLNLKNIEPDKVFRIDWSKQTCHFHKGAYQYFARSTNLNKAGIISTKTLVSVTKANLVSKHPKSYIRGKFELWIFWKILN